MICVFTIDEGIKVLKKEIIKMKEKTCRNCGQAINKNAVICTSCGAKIKKPLFKKWWFWLIIVICVAGISVSNNDNKTNDVSDKTVVSDEELVLSEDEYKAQCVSVPYNDIARNPNNYKGQKAVFKGQVIQVQESGKNVVLRINTTQGQYGLWDDTIYVDYKRKDDNESRVLDDDIVTVYGEIKGIKDYRAVLGNQISIPHIEAAYIDIQ